MRHSLVKPSVLLLFGDSGAHCGARQMTPVLYFSYTVSPPVLEPSFAFRIREESILVLCNSLGDIPGSAAPGGWLVPGSAAAVVVPDCACALHFCFCGVEPGPYQGDRKVEGSENCPPGQLEIAK